MKGTSRVDVALLILRVAIGLILLIYGCQKMLGIFGGAGFEPTLGYLTKGYGVPAVFGILAIIAEFFGSICLILGLLTPVAAFGLACNMAVATFFQVRTPGALKAIFVAGDTATMAKVFFPAALLFVCVAIMLLGAGKYSLDAKFFRRGR